MAETIETFLEKKQAGDVVSTTDIAKMMVQIVMELNEVEPSENDEQPNMVIQPSESEGDSKGKRKRRKAKKTVVLTEKQALKMIDVFEQAIMICLAKGLKVRLTGFAKLFAKYTAPRRGNNVFTGQPIDIPEGVRYYIKPGRNLKKMAKSQDKEFIEAFKSMKEKKALKNE